MGFSISVTNLVTCQISPPAKFALSYDKYKLGRLKVKTCFLQDTKRQHRASIGTPAYAVSWGSVTHFDKIAVYTFPHTYMSSLMPMFG